MNAVLSRFNPITKKWERVAEIEPFELFKWAPSNLFQWIKFKWDSYQLRKFIKRIVRDPTAEKK